MILALSLSVHYRQGFIRAKPKVVVDIEETSYIMAAIDRVIHHSVILDMMDVESFRAKEASSFHLHTSEQNEDAL